MNSWKYGARTRRVLLFNANGDTTLGLDKFCLLVLKRRNIRDVIAFLKVQSSADLMSNAPSSVGTEQLRELGISIV